MSLHALGYGSASSLLINARNNHGSAGSNIVRGDVLRVVGSKVVAPNGDDILLVEKIDAATDIELNSIFGVAQNPAAKGVTAADGEGEFLQVIVFGYALLNVGANVVAADAPVGIDEVGFVFKKSTALDDGPVWGKFLGAKDTSNLAPAIVNFLNRTVASPIDHGGAATAATIVTGLIQMASFGGAAEA